MIWPWIVKYCSRQKMRLTHNTLLVPFGDFVAVFRPTFIWYSFVNVAGRKKSSLLSSSAGEFSVEHQQCKSNFPWLFSSCLHKEAEKIGRRPCWAFQKNDAWYYTTHCYEAHDLTYIKSLLLTPKNTHQKLKWIHVINFFWKNKIIRPELSTSKKVLLLLRRFMDMLRIYFYPSFEELL